VTERVRSYGQDAVPSSVDRFGRWLSTTKMRRLLGDTRGQRAADIGCGFDGALGRTLFASARSVVFVDIHVDPHVAQPSRTILEGYLPDVLGEVPDDSLDVIICNNVLEHLDERPGLLRELYRITAPGGRCVINVPSWRGKFFLELAAFRLGLAPKEEMEDHKVYYDPRDLWPELVAAGFRPSHITLRRHKFGLNTIARCRKP
jgi:SAM-dependent methyltransferase